MKRLILVMLAAFSALGFAQNPPALTRAQADALYGAKDSLLRQLMPLRSLQAVPPAGPYYQTGPSSQAITVLNQLSYGFPIGVLPAGSYNYLAFQYQSYTPGSLNYLRAEVTSVSSTGSILAQGWETPGCPKPGITKWAVIWFDKPVVSDGVTQLYVRLRGDASFCMQRLDSVIYDSTTYAASATTVSSCMVANPVTWTAEGTQRNFYVRLGAGPSLAAADSAPIETTQTLYNSATDVYTGWAGPEGSVSGNVFDFDIYPGNGGYLPTYGRLVIREGTATGKILFQSTSALNLVAGQFNRIRFYGQRVRSSNAFVQLRFDGRTGFRFWALNTYPTPTYAAAQYTSDVTINGAAWSSSASQRAPWMRSYSVDPTQMSLGAEQDIANSIAGILTGQYTPTIYLPSNIYAVTGTQSRVYFRDVVGVPPGIDPSYYSYVVTCAKGRQESDSWVFDPVDGDAGTTTFTLDVYFLGVKVATASPTLNITAKATGNGTTRKVCVIGDSWSAAVSSDGKWETEVANLSANSTGLKCSWVGVTSATAVDSGGTSRTITHNAVSGQTISYFATNAASPFVFSSAFNFATYMSTNSFSMTTGDSVVILLDVNDVGAAATDAAALQSIFTMLTNLQTMVTSIHSYAAGINVCICIGRRPNPSQDSFGLDYGTSKQAWRVRRNLDLWNRELLRVFDTSAMRTAKTFVVPIWCDMAHNAGQSSTTTLTVTGATNASPIVVTTSLSHYLWTGASVTISGAVGNTATNGTFTITKLSDTTFSLNGSTGNGTWTSGGSATVNNYYNSRSSMVMTRSPFNSGFHPLAAGYYQVADAVWSFLRGLN